MKNIKNLIPLYPVINVILFQILVFMAFSRDYPERLKLLAIYMDIAVILSCLFLFLLQKY